MHHKVFFTPFGCLPKCRGFYTIRLIAFFRFKALKISLNLVPGTLIDEAGQVKKFSFFDWRDCQSQ